MAITINGSGTLSGVTAGLTSASMPAGSVLQVLQNNLTSTAETLSTSYVDTGLSQAITPSNASNKVLIRAVVNGGWDNNAAKIAVGLFKDSESDPLIRSDQDGSNRQRVQSVFYINIDSSTPIPLSLEYLDSPSTTNSVTYKVKFKRMDPQGTVTINKGSDEYTDSTIFGPTVSVLTVMEIKG